MRRILVGIGLSVGLLAGGAEAASLTAQRSALLRLDGALVKWGAPKLGTPATVTYAILRRPRTFPGARNCTAMLPMERVLEPIGATLAMLDTELEAAMRLWSAAARITFVRVEDDRTAQIVIGAQAERRGIAFANVERDKAATEGVAGIAQATICLDPSVTWEVTPDGNDTTYALRYVLTHELGHAIGLDHPGPEGGVMGFRYTEPSQEISGLALGSLDLAAVTALYGTKSTTLATVAPPAEPRRGGESGCTPRADTALAIACGRIAGGP